MPIHVLDGVDLAPTRGVGATDWGAIIDGTTKLVNVGTQLTDKGFGWYNQQKDLEHRRKMDELNADIQRQNDEHLRRLQEMQMKMQMQAPTYPPPAPAPPASPVYHAAPPRPMVTATGGGSQSKMLILAVAGIGALALLLLATRK